MLWAFGSFMWYEYVLGASYSAHTEGQFHGAVKDGLGVKALKRCSGALDGRPHPHARLSVAPPPLARLRFVGAHTSLLAQERS